MSEQFWAPITISHWRNSYTSFSGTNGQQIVTLGCLGNINSCTPLSITGSSVFRSRFKWGNTYPSRHRAQTLQLGLSLVKKKKTKQWSYAYHCPAGTHSLAEIKWIFDPTSKAWFTPVVKITYQKEFLFLQLINNKQIISHSVGERNGNSKCNHLELQVYLRHPEFSLCSFLLSAILSFYWTSHLIKCDMMSPRIRT